MVKMTLKTFRVFFFLSIASIVFSCTSKLEAGSGSAQKALNHIVCFQFKDEIPMERRQQAVSDFLALKEEIPEIKSFEGGENISTEGLDKGFTHCFILGFADEAARDIYVPHPAHKKLAAKNKPLMKDLVVVDVWVNK